MKVTPVIPDPPPKAFIVEMTEDELFRLYLLSHTHESGTDGRPYPTGYDASGTRLYQDVPEYIRRAGNDYLKMTQRSGGVCHPNPFIPNQKGSA